MRATMILLGGLLILFGATTSAVNSMSEREIEFVSSGTRLSGTVVLPSSRPEAALVILHGGGKLERMLPISRKLAGENIAVFTYDKRGVGKSEGSFDDLGKHAARGIEQLALDAVAAVEVLARQPEVENIDIGLMGFSQAGWVAPIAANRSHRIKYMALWSAPVCTLGEELHFSAVAEHNATYMATHSPEQIREYMRAAPHRSDDVDPSWVLEQLFIPGLWVFGGKDHSIPVQLSIERLQQFQRSGHTNFEYMLFPDVGHNLTDEDGAEYDALVRWIKQTQRESRNR